MKTNSALVGIAVASIGIIACLCILDADGADMRFGVVVHMLIDQATAQKAASGVTSIIPTAPLVAAAKADLANFKGGCPLIGAKATAALLDGVADRTDQLGGSVLPDDVATLRDMAACFTQTARVEEAYFDDQRPR